ncbi:MAG: transketolase [Pseudonocardiales bacterium]|nr:transketolase [Pseudonocardiales bacterium]
MRAAFVQAAIELLETRDDVVVVLAAISADRFADVPRHVRDRVVDVEIREQAMIGVAGGLALAGMRPIVHTYAPFLVERAFEQIKLDLSHQNVPAVLVSIGASYDEAAYGRTHQAPGDVALLSTLPDWRIEVPSHPTDVRPLLRRAVEDSGRTYLRLSETTARSGGPLDGALRVVRRGRRGVVLAVGPMIDRAISAAEGLDLTVLHAVTAYPLDARTLRDEVVRSDSPIIFLVEPYLAGTAASQIADALAEIPHRLISHGVRNVDLHRFGTTLDHDRAHGLDLASLRERLGDQPSR